MRGNLVAGVLYSLVIAFYIVQHISNIYLKVIYVKSLHIFAYYMYLCCDTIAIIKLFKRHIGFEIETYRYNI